MKLIKWLKDLWKPVKLGKLFNPIRSVIMPTSRPWGMHPLMWEAYKDAVKDSGLTKWPRIVQTLGNAPASKGVHAKDGQFLNEKGKWEDYCAAIDISVKGFFGIGSYNEKQIKWLLYHMSRHGYVGWYRYRRSFKNNRHLHSIFVKVKMKKQLRNQVVSFLHDRDGLAGDEKEPFWTAPPEWDNVLEAAFEAANDVNVKGIKMGLTPLDTDEEIVDYC